MPWILRLVKSGADDGEEEGQSANVMKINWHNVSTIA
jgi:hypothetical protein